MNPTELRARLAALDAVAGGPAIPEALAAPIRSDDALDLIDADLVPAAVLVPIVLGPAPGVLLTKRTAHLTKHAGQVSFPGGRMDPEDPHPEAAALREAAEEIGLEPSRRARRSAARLRHRHRLPHHARARLAAAGPRPDPFTR